jgi:NADPH:quinone reductase-like Zn-dependent oxidoreductase
VKAVRFHGYGDAGVLRYEDVDRPRPGPGEVLVRVAATAFNPVDPWLRFGITDRIFPASFPHTPARTSRGPSLSWAPVSGRPALERR